ncbi:uncharacterized protein LOC100855163, partial [Vitis vinifera]|uniref:uncharacterized protein LOC100855163 n=1 Tax=Vitis vinifera TaxID=29760 RepID=UPI0028831516
KYPSISLLSFSVLSVLLSCTLSLLQLISTVGGIALSAGALSCRSLWHTYFTFLSYMGNRGVIGDKWSSRILWLVAIGSAAEKPSFTRVQAIARVMNSS